jgi:hypothetical protein
MKIQAGAVTLAFLVAYLGENVFNIRAGNGSVSLLLLLLTYGIAFGGAHFYLALCGHNGPVPVRSRWRYVAMVLMIWGAGAVSVVDEGTGATIAVLALFGYFIIEGVYGYQESMIDQH